MKMKLDLRSSCLATRKSDKLYICVGNSHLHRKLLLIYWFTMMYFLPTRMIDLIINICDR